MQAIPQDYEITKALNSLQSGLGARKSINSTANKCFFFTTGTQIKEYSDHPIQIRSTQKDKVLRSSFGYSPVYFFTHNSIFE